MSAQASGAFGRALTPGDAGKRDLKGVLTDLYQRTQPKAPAQEQALPAIATAGTELSHDAVAGLRFLLKDFQSLPELEAIKELARARLFRPETKAVFAAAVHDARTVGRNALLELDDWGPGEPKLVTPRAIDEAKRSRKRILLAIHGTFSSSGNLVGYFQPALQQAIDRTYSAVLAFDHYTLTLNPRQNAEDLRDQLVAYLDKNGCLSSHKVDIICHSRGGLVARCLVEKLFHPNESPFGHVHFVAAPNGGTHLASPANVGKILEQERDIVALAGSLLGSPDLGALLKEIDSMEEAAQVLGLVPGLEAMDPHGTFVSALNSEPPERFPTYSAACADREQDGVDHPEPRYANLFRKLAPTGAKLLWEAYMALNHKDGAHDYLMDRIFEGRPNDLVVDSDSVMHIHPRRTGDPVLSPQNVLCFAHPLRFEQWESANWVGVELLRGVQRVEDGSVDHSGYFAHPEWNKFVIKQLQLG